jgi:hypothetical protein
VLVYRMSDFVLTLGTALLAHSAVERTLARVAAETPAGELDRAEPRPSH